MKKHRAKKRLGQNFLIDESIIESILSAIKPQKNDNIVEIGGGEGALSLPLSDMLAKLDIIEVDDDLIPVLKKKIINKNVNIINSDVMKVDFSQFGSGIRFVGNLPYNIATALLLKLTNYKDSITDMFFMLQKEVAMRICAKENDKNYGRLSVFLSYFFDSYILQEVAPASFRPSPKVQSAIVHFVPKKITNKVTNIKDFSLIIKICFAKRRKTLNNNLKETFDKERLLKININGQRRAQTLTLYEFISLANEYTQHKQKTCRTLCDNIT
jgi:16S rRNA (adenine1518-N6/adenine1519-N6)-dimethyltransferase